MSVARWLRWASAVSVLPGCSLLLTWDAVRGPPDGGDTGGSGPGVDGSVNNDASTVAGGAGVPASGSEAGVPAAAHGGGGGLIGSGGISAGGGTHPTGGVPTGGVDGVGGIPPNGGAHGELGTACQTRTQCLSGYCAANRETGDWVCCDAPCDGVCSTCSSAGRCVAPGDDTNCGTILCPMSTACRSYPDTMTSNRCKSLGVCKVPTDCPHTDSAARIPCAGSPPDQSLCDGDGQCRRPTVVCGTSATCPVSPGICCYTYGATQADSVACQSDSTGCTTGAVAAFSCDSEADCPSGTVCCLSGQGTWSTSCVPAASCASPYPVTFIIVCDPNAAISVCPSGRSCQPGSSAPGPPLAGTGYHYCL
jgi:hypothetical protein